MTKEQKQQLFPYFAYLYSIESNPDLYEGLNLDEWVEKIQEDEDFAEEIAGAFDNLSSEELESYWEQYQIAQQEAGNAEIEMAKKGTKLKKLQEFKKGTKMGKKEKCACGCDLITKKEKGGTLVDECTCCGEVHKHEEGGIMKFQNPSGAISPWRTVANYGGSEGDPRFLNFISRIFSRKNTSKSSGNTSVKQKPQTQWERNARTYNKEEIKNMPGYERVYQEKYGYLPGYVGEALVVTASPTSASQTNKPTVNPTPGTTRTQPTGGTGGAPQRVTTQSGGLTSTSGAVRTPSGNNAGGVTTQSPNQRGNRNTSIVDYLNSKGIDSSKKNRALLAKKLGIENYNYSAAKNTELLRKFMQTENPSIADKSSTSVADNYDKIKPSSNFNIKTTSPTTNPTMVFNDRPALPTTGVIKIPKTDWITEDRVSLPEIDTKDIVERLSQNTLVVEPSRWEKRRRDTKQKKRI